jgi:hypothetical protein
MPCYIIYDNNGIILQTGFCSETSLRRKEKNPEPGRNMIRGVVDDMTKYKVINKKIVRK